MNFNFLKQPIFWTGFTSASALFISLYQEIRHFKENKIIVKIKISEIYEEPTGSYDDLFNDNEFISNDKNKIDWKIEKFFNVSVINKGNKPIKISDVYLLINIDKIIKFIKITLDEADRLRQILPNDGITYKKSYDLLKNYNFNDIVIKAEDTTGKKYYSCNWFLRLFKLSRIHKLKDLNYGPSKTK